MIAVPLLLAELLLGYVVWDRHRFERAQLDPRVYLGAAARSGAGHAGLYSRAARAAQHSKRLCRRLQTAVRRQRRPHLTGRVQRSAATIAVVVDCHAAQGCPPSTSAQAAGIKTAVFDLDPKRAQRYGAGGGTLICPMLNGSVRACLTRL